MGPRLVLDTNILISGLLFGGPPRALLELALERLIELLTSAPLEHELERVLHAKFPERLDAVILETQGALFDLAVHIEPAESLSVIKEDPDDNRVLECAVSGRADAIISGDRHLLALGSFRGIPILTPQAALARWAPKPR